MFLSSPANPEGLRLKKYRGDEQRHSREAFKGQVKGNRSPRPLTASIDVRGNQVMRGDGNAIQPSLFFSYRNPVLSVAYGPVRGAPFPIPEGAPTLGWVAQEVEHTGNRPVRSQVQVLPQPPYSFIIGDLNA